MNILLAYGSVQFGSVAQSCLTLCDPMNRNTPGFPAHGRYGQITFQIKMLEQLDIHKQNSGFSHLTQKLTQRPKCKA